MSDSKGPKLGQRIKEAGGYCKTKANDTITKYRDRRRTARQNIEEILDRKTAVSLLILGPAGKIMETFGVPIFMAHAPVINSVSAAWAAFLVIGVAIGVWWHRLAKAVESAADTVEEATE